MFQGYTGPIPPPDFVPHFLTGTEDQTKVVEEVSGGTTPDVPYYPPRLTRTTVCVPPNIYYYTEPPGFH